MDDNKLAELRRIEYRIPPSCGICVFGVFVGLSDWGTCAKHEYQHKKHSGPKRKLSIYRAGSCPKFERDQEVIAKLGGFAEFTNTCS